MQDAQVTKSLRVGLHFFHFNLICNMTTFRKEQGKFDEFISPDEGLLRETCKSQNINPILSSP